MSEQVYMCNFCGGIYQAMIAECDCTVGVPFVYQTMTVIDGDLRADVLALLGELESYSVDVYLSAYGHELIKRISERLRGSEWSKQQ